MLYAGNLRIFLIRPFLLIEPHTIKEISEALKIV